MSDTLRSGQLFHWEPHRIDGIDGFAGCIGAEPPSWIAQPEPDVLLVSGPDLERVISYFGIEQPMSTVHATFPQNDAVLAEAMAYCPGIRLACQPVWECLATFITSSLKQVAHIRGISLQLRSRFGRKFFYDERSFFAYPEPLAIAEAGEAALRECALGYRAKSLHRAAVDIVEGRFDLESMSQGTMDEEDLRDELLKLHGVGEKIANCTLLFGCGKWGAFPIDVWIERILREKYRKRLKGAKLQQWAVNYFGENAGYAQQYLFHFARKTLK
ncbi:MAG: hypothetical protein AAGA96_06570 [Verrucomicrobiota bacterium]